MNHPPNIMLVGLGAIGVIYADRLHKSYPDSFSVLVDTERKDRYLKDGVYLNNELCSFVYITPEDDVEPADLMLVSVKQHHLAHAIDLMQPFINENTVILSLLNGITSEEILAQAFPESHVLHGFCVGTDAVRLGTRTNAANIGKIVFGEKDQPVPSEKVVAISQLFEGADIPSQVPEDILREQWWKFMMNVGINQVSSVSGATYGDFCKRPEALELSIMASREVVTLASYENVSLTEDDIEKYVSIISSLSPKGKTSMLQDVEAGRQTEVELFSGTVIALGQKHGVKTPVNDVLYRLICLKTK